MSADQFKTALKQNPQLKAAAVAFEQERRAKALERLAKAMEVSDIYRAQGALAEIEQTIITLER